MVDEGVFCYNKGCGKKFQPDKNDENSCKFHPGQPVFHDAYKGWGCCNKKVTDFTEFLNIPGCTSGLHNPNKPAEPEKKRIVEQGEKAEDEELTENVPKAKPPPAQASRDAKDQPLVALKKTVSPALTEMLQKAKEEAAAKMEEKEKEAEKGPVEIAEGTPCKNSACGRSFSAEVPPNCWHHPGTAIFHEGMKYWSCCRKKTSDFDSFLSQPGCTRGEHRWIAEEKEVGAELECRDDFHQTASHVVVTYYLKKSNPELTNVTANPVALSVQLHSIHGDSKHIDIDLWGAVDVSASSYTLTPSKVEVKLKKADPVSWTRLNYVPPKED